MKGLIKGQGFYLLRACTSRMRAPPTSLQTSPPSPSPRADSSCPAAPTTSVLRHSPIQCNGQISDPTRAQYKTVPLRLHNMTFYQAHWHFFQVWISIKLGFGEKLRKLLRKVSHLWPDSLRESCLLTVGCVKPVLTKNDTPGEEGVSSRYFNMGYKPGPIMH